MKVIVLNDGNGHASAFTCSNENLLQLARVILRENESNTILEPEDVAAIEDILNNPNRVIEDMKELESLMPTGRTYGNLVEIIDVEDFLPTGFLLM